MSIRSIMHWKLFRLFSRLLTSFDALGIFTAISRPVNRHVQVSVPTPHSKDMYSVSVPAEQKAISSNVYSYDSLGRRLKHMLGLYELNTSNWVPYRRPTVLLQPTALNKNNFLNQTILYFSAPSATALEISYRCRRRLKFFTSTKIFCAVSDSD